VGEVHVPLKVDRYGRRFGFVKFQEVKDEDVLGSRSEEVWRGDTRLKVQKAKFGRQEKQVQPPLSKRAVVGGRGMGLWLGNLSWRWFSRVRSELHRWC